mmetsp:Transcript_97250/g.279425  ORF Transcript_97250/g.279425 Transcript_97250/m.279425 type:complete len:269 (-) Transcript_97250:346-1152(-)
MSKRICEGGAASPNAHNKRWQIRSGSSVSVTRPFGPFSSSCHTSSESSVFASALFESRSSGQRCLQAARCSQTVSTAATFHSSATSCALGMTATAPTSVGNSRSERRRRRRSCCLTASPFLWGQRGCCHRGRTSTKYCRKRCSKSKIEVFEASARSLMEGAVSSSMLPPCLMQMSAVRSSGKARDMRFTELSRRRSNPGRPKSAIVAFRSSIRTPLAASSLIGRLPARTTLRCRATGTRLLTAPPSGPESILPRPREAIATCALEDSP